MSEKSEMKSSFIFRKQTNPEFRNYVNEKLNKGINSLKSLKSQLNQKSKKEIYIPKFENIIQELTLIRTQFELYSVKFKYYTQDTESSLRNFAYLLREFLKELDFNIEAFNEERNEIYLLNISNLWTTFISNTKTLFYSIENSDYPYLIHTIFSLAFVFVPFLNIISLVGAIYLLLQKDWRALSFGLVVLALYLIQIINVFNLAI